MEQEAQSVEDEVVLHFRRFPQEKQEQVRALVNYATLMGLDGKDLVSIGGKLDRIKAKQEIERNREIVRSMGTRTIGKDSNRYRRWAWTSGDGTVYHFEGANWSEVRVTNTKTKVTARVRYSNDYPVGRWALDSNRSLCDVMLNIYHGDIKLP
jgi:hypothetical protein